LHFHPKKNRIGHSTETKTKGRSINKRNSGGRNTKLRELVKQDMIFMVYKGDGVEKARS